MPRKKKARTNCGYYCDYSMIFPIVSIEVIITYVGNHNIE